MAEHVITLGEFETVGNRLRLRKVLFGGMADSADQAEMMARDGVTALTEETITILPMVYPIRNRKQVRGILVAARARFEQLEASIRDAVRAERRGE